MRDPGSLYFDRRGNANYSGPDNTFDPCRHAPITWCVPLTPQIVALLGGAVGMCVAHVVVVAAALVCRYGDGFAQHLVFVHNLIANFAYSLGLLSDTMPISTCSKALSIPTSACSFAIGRVTPSGCRCRLVPRPRTRRPGREVRLPKRCCGASRESVCAVGGGRWTWCSKATPVSAADAEREVGTTIGSRRRTSRG